VQNIVCKTNEKLGGINYTLHLRDERLLKILQKNIFFKHFSVHELTEETLFIGLSTSHPGAMSDHERARGATPQAPSVIGVSFF
jgi:hypothetical protein